MTRACSPDASPVFDAMHAAPHARLTAALNLGAGGRVAVWRNARAQVRYADTPYHTLTLYLTGGADMVRMEQGTRPQAAAQRVCVLPAGAPSGWQVERSLTLVHLYQPDAVLREHLAAECDRDPSGLTLPEITFGDDPIMTAGLRRLAAVAQAGGEGAPLAAQQIAAELRHHLLTRIVGRAGPRTPVTGGLGAHRTRAIRALVEDALDQTLDLARLSDGVGLSPWHFQRAFTQTFGQSPHAYVSARRVARAEAMLRRGEPPAEVAVACGYSSQSHLTRAFNAARLLTPARYAALAARVVTCDPVHG